MSGDQEQALVAYCINLDDRPDKWDATVAAIAGTGIELVRFSGVKHKEGWKGCGLAHVAVAQEAMRKGLAWVLIVEDDCLPVPDFASRWPDVRSALWREKGAWDLFLGGPTFVQGPAGLLGAGAGGPSLLEIGQGYALHFYVLNASAYERCLAWNPDRHGPIDVYYSNQFRLVTTVPRLALQRAGLSDIHGYERNYSAEFEDADTALARLQYGLDARGGALMAVALGFLAVLWVYAKP